ncbi:MAG: zinc-binding dehydrogenase [Chloroflexi bacterium]|nr:zinc-binding dehydrogenase [Chloroflexota bacterium]
MRGARFLGDRKLEVTDFPDVEPGPNEVLIRTRASGMCGSDLHTYRAPAADVNTENRPGHEPCGEVAALGPGVTKARIGDRAMIHHYVGCGNCRFCREGYQQLCSNKGPWTKYYGGSAHGGHGEYMVCHESTLVPMPDAIDYDVGSMIACGTSTAWLALEKLQVSGRDIVAIFGQGPVGVAGTMLAAEMGARVIAVDLSDERLELAKKAGAWETINASNVDSVEAIRDLTHGEGADASLEAVGAGPTRQQAAQACRVFGRTALVGERGEATYDATPDIIHRHLTLYGSWTVSKFGMEDCANFIADHNIPMASLIERRVNIEDTVEAYEYFDKQTSGKMVITFG